MFILLYCAHNQLIIMLIDINIFVITACAISNVLTKATVSAFSAAFSPRALAHILHNFFSIFLQNQL